MDLEDARYDGSATARLTGHAGLFKGERAVVHVGQCMTVGRSRMCDVSVARTAECLRLGKESLERHKSYRKISRKHLRICLLGPDHLEIEDLSTNGTLVNGHRVDKVLIHGFSKAGSRVSVEFGEGEILVLEPAGPHEHDPREDGSRAHTESGFPLEGRANRDRTPVP